jgi:hypothetical protein
MTGQQRYVSKTRALGGAAMSSARRFLSAVGILVAVEVLPGCASAPSPVAPQVVSSAATTSDGEFLYVSESSKNAVGIYSYPRLKRIGSLSVKTPEGLCVNPRSGNVWVVSGPLTNEVSEFKRGGTKPIRVLQIGNSLTGYFLDACAVNPINGDLAVVTTVSSSSPGGLFVFKHGTGTPKFYHDPEMFAYAFVGYDSTGDAFVDGTDTNDSGRLGELPAGAKQMEDVTPQGLKLRFPGGVQYDGTDLAVGDERYGRIYRISGTTITGTTRLNDACLVRQFFIDTTSDVLIAPSACKSKSQVLVYDYPAGGAAVKKLSGLISAYGVVISR